MKRSTVIACVLFGLFLGVIAWAFVRSESRYETRGVGTRDLHVVIQTDHPTAVKSVHYEAFSGPYELTADTREWYQAHPERLGRTALVQGNVATLRLTVVSSTIELRGSYRWTPEKHYSAAHETKALVCVELAGRKPYVGVIDLPSLRAAPTVILTIPPEDRPPAAPQPEEPKP